MCSYWRVEFSVADILDLYQTRRDIAAKPRGTRPSSGDTVEEVFYRWKQPNRIPWLLSRKKSWLTTTSSSSARGQSRSCITMKCAQTATPGLTSAAGAGAEPSEEISCPTALREFWSSEVQGGTPKLAQLGGKRAVVANLRGNFFAVGEVCTHVGASLYGKAQRICDYLYVAWVQV